MGSRISIKFGTPYRIALILLLNKLYKVDIRCICLDQIVIIHISYPAVFQPIIWMVLCEDTFKECTKHIYVHKSLKATNLKFPSLLSKCKASINFLEDGQELHSFAAY